MGKKFTKEQGGLAKKGGMKKKAYLAGLTLESCTHIPLVTGRGAKAKTATHKGFGNKY